MKRKSIPLRNQRIMMHPAELTASNRGSFYPHRRGHVHRSPGLVALSLVKNSNRWGIGGNFGVPSTIMGNDA